MKRIVLLFALITSLASISQITEGHVKYKIKLDTDEEINPMAQMMLKSATFELFFRENQTRTEFSMGALMKMVTITKDNDILMLMSGMMGKKAIKSTTSDMKSETDTNNEAPEYEVKFTDETKEIQGFTCKKAIVIIEEGVESIFWYSEAIDINKAGQAYLNEAIPGFPLEFEINQGGMMITMTATKFEDSVGNNPEKLFNMVIPDGYEETSIEEVGGQ